MNPRISVLVSARQDSKYLAKFLFGYFENKSANNLELLVMMNKDDTWNTELRGFLGQEYGVRFFFEDYKLGRSGLHVYFNELYEHATGDWVVYFCEDHFINRHGWDRELVRTIQGTDIETDPAYLHHDPLDSEEPYIIIPKFDNAGAMNHVLSRGFTEAIGGLGKHGWIDSYINDLLPAMPVRNVLRVDEEWYHDFSHDHPSPMEEGHMQSQIGLAGRRMPKYGSGPVVDLLREDSAKLKEAFSGL